MSEEEETTEMEYENLETDSNDETKDNEGFSLELGDVVEIISPSNPDYHDQTFFIHYINETRIEIVNITTYQLEKLNIDTDGSITDESITEINLISRSEEKGYARQNGLLPKKWITIHFGGEIPLIITGLITNLEEDEIEVTTYPDNDVLFINFEYKGLPEDIPIEKIAFRDAPRGALLEAAAEKLSANSEESLFNESEASITFTEDGESIINIPNSVSADENIREVLHSVYLDANELFGEDLEEIFQVVEIPDSEKRYGIDIQVNDFTDELLSSIPTSRRTSLVMKRVHNLVERFKELRRLYSKFDENGNVTGKKINGDLIKPLIQHMTNLDVKLRWLIPVVSQRKKLYDLSDEGGEDTISLKSNDDLISQNEILTNYYKNNVPGEELKYDYMFSRTHETMTPFSPPVQREDFLAFNKEVKTDLEAIVNNLDDFYTTVSEQAISTKKYTPTSSKFRYFVQKYNLGMTKLSGLQNVGQSKIFLKSRLTPNDKVTVKSLIVMSEPVMRYSHVDMPATNILIRSQLSQTSLDYFRIFKKSRDISQKNIDNLETEIDYESQEKEEDGIRFLSEITEFVLDESVGDETEKYNKFLNVIIPKIRTLIRLVRKYMKDKLTFIDVVKTLEPFMIYPDNISYGQYNEIRYFLKEKIKDFKTSFSTKSMEYSSFKNATYKVRGRENRMKVMLSEKRDIQDRFIETYKIHKNKKTDDSVDTGSSSELLHLIIDTDQSKLFSTLLSSMLLALVTPNKLMDYFDEPELGELNSYEKIGSDGCVRRFLSKKYKSIAELQKDNSVEDLYYDKEYDDTPYSILKKYEDEKKKMLPEKFVQFLAENLIQKHDCPRHMADELASTLIAGKKAVRDGEYAILELKPALPDSIDKSSLSEKEKSEIAIEESVRTKYHYYKRRNGHWVKDEDIDEEVFMDNNTLFCNIDFKCQKNQSVNTCDPENAVEIRLKRLASENALKEFDKRYTISVEEMTALLEKGIEEYTYSIQKLRVLKENQLTKSNFIAYEIGKYANKDDILVSPYAKLYDLVLSQDDFVKKQSDICKLVSEFCREPLVDEQKEDQHWLYCKETNTKLVPQSIFLLANAFISGDNYLDKLDELCHAVGTISDDGDAWVDKFCGCVLRKIDAVNEDGYDATGFKITSHGIIEKDLGTVAAEVLNKREIKERKVFEDETTDIAHNVFYTICNNMEVPMDVIESFVMRISMELITDSSVLLSEKKYVKRSEKLEKEKGKIQIPYRLYKNQTIISIVGSAILVSVQTVIPSFKIRKTFPGCIRSFSGYPMDGGIEDTTGLKYIACVIDKSKSPIPPWDSIQKLTSAIIEKRIKDVLDKYIVGKPEIVELYLKKREYMLLNPDEIPPEEHSVSKWKNFLPPIVDFSVVSSLKGTSSEFDEETVELIRKGHKNTQEHLNVYVSKNIQHGYGIIESINSIVRTKDALLKTSAKVPFLENACCNEDSDNTNPIKYFTKEDKNIDLFIKRVAKNETIIKNVKAFTNPGILFNDEDSTIKRPVLPNEITEKNIYHAFIFYCNFDSDVPIPNDLEFVCREKPEDGYDKKWTIEEKMEFLKKHGKRYSTDDLHNLMSIINKRNISDSNSELVVMPINMLKELLESFELKDSRIIEEPLRKLLGELLLEYNSKTYIDEEDKTMTPFNKAINRLRNYLQKTNDNMHKKIMEFFDKYGNFSKAQFDSLQEYILNIHKWKLDRSMKESGLYYDDGLYTVTTFLKNSIYTMSRVFPNSIFNNVQFNKVHKHWGLSDEHMMDISSAIKKSYEELNKFKTDTTLLRFLQNANTWSVDLNLFIQHIPIHTPILKDGSSYFSLFDKRTLYLLFSYCWYSTIYEFIVSSDDEDLLKLDIQESKRSRRQAIDELNDPANILGAVVSNPNLDEDIFDYESDMVDVQIVSGNKMELKTKVCSMLYSFISIEKVAKNALDQRYESISKKVNRTKQQEKKSITDFLENLEKDELRIEDMLKKFKMGRWNIGMQKGVFQYDKATYEREREGNLARMYNDLEINDLENYEQVDMDVNQLMALEEQDNIEQYDGEGMDIGHFDEEYADGVYYQEDQDHDFGYEE